jgi:hypothetical protein
MLSYASTLFDVIEIVENILEHFYYIFHIG